MVEPGALAPQETHSTRDLAPADGRLAPSSDGTTQQHTYTLVSCLGDELRSSSYHVNARRLKASCGIGCIRPDAAPDDPSSARCISACAIVPLYPNELTPAHDAFTFSAVCWTPIMQLTDCISRKTCGLTTRS
jgi:hypothetical protein